jgi:uncharacterized damage-inducible protein DinB
MTATTQQEALTALLIERWEKASRKLEELGAAIPADSLDSLHVAGIRSSASGVLRHVAYWNQYFANTLRGNPADSSGEELPAAAYPTKASVLKVLQESSAAAATAVRELRGPLDPKTAELILSFVEHTSEHYGQLVVFTRMMGIVPPASRT